MMTETQERQRYPRIQVKPVAIAKYWSVLITVVATELKYIRFCRGDVRIWSQRRRDYGSYDPFYILLALLW